MLHITVGSEVGGTSCLLRMERDPHKLYAAWYGSEATILPKIVLNW